MKTRACDRVTRSLENCLIGVVSGLIRFIFRPRVRKIRSSFWPIGFDPWRETLKLRLSSDLNKWISEYPYFSHRDMFHIKKICGLGPKYKTMVLSLNIRPWSCDRLTRYTQVTKSRVYSIHTFKSKFKLIFRVSLWWGLNSWEFIPKELKAV